MTVEIIVPRKRERFNDEGALLQLAVNRMRQIIRTESDDPNVCLRLVIQELNRLSIRATGFSL